MKKLGNRLKSARLRLGFTLREAANKTNGVSYTAIDNMEKGRIQEPSPHSLYYLCETLKLDYIEMMVLAGYLIPKRDLKAKK